MHHYKHHIGDYRRDTMHLSLLEHGCYRQLLDMYYLSEEPIPKETESVIRRLCVRTEEEAKAIQTVLNEFFTPTEKGWIHGRCDREIDTYQGKADRARGNGKLGGRPKKTEVVISGNQSATKTKANHKPLTTNQEPKDNAFDAEAFLVENNVSESVAADWLALRKKKRAANTKTAMDGVLSEARKAGLSLDAALQMACRRNWQGFEAAWVTNPTPAGPSVFAGVK
jgi:uncharacterized protein YdaU (DUF1376 family)